METYDLEKFEKLVNRRKKWVDSNHDNDFDFDEILAGLYGDPSHFIYEILQNADDVKARLVSFALFHDRFEVFHNGTDFTFQNVEGITGIGKGTKRDDLTKIGKFGIGFKSVYAITQSPIVHSGTFHFAIKDFVVPEQIDSITPNDGTKIILPFNHSKRSRAEIYDLVANRLRNIGLTSLLFLKYIDAIKWETSDAKGHYLRDKKRVGDHKALEKAFLTSESASEKYLKFERPVKIGDDELKVEIAYQLSEDGSRIVDAAQCRLFAFFPTDKETFLNFLVQGPYRTTPARDNIPLDDKINKKLIQETAYLVADSLEIVKELDLLDVGFLNSLPLRKELTAKGELYSEIHSQILNRIGNSQLLPAADGSFVRAKDALLADGKELIDLLSSDDTNLLFGRSNWLDYGILLSKAQYLRGCLVSELGIPEISFEDFAKKLDSGLLSNKPDGWMMNFYSSLREQKRLWKYSGGILRAKPFIRLEDGSHIAPYKLDGRAIQVYLPTEATTQYPTVKRSLVQHEECLDFLRELGLHEPDLLDEINEYVIPRYSREEPVSPDENYSSDFDKLLTASSTVSQQEKYSLISSLKNLPFILSHNPATNQLQLKKAGQVYLPIPDLKKYFLGNEKAFFVADELHQRFEKEKLEAFLKEIGVEDRPRRVRFAGNLSDELKRNLRKESTWGDANYTREIRIDDYTIDGMDVILSSNNLNEQTSLLLWKRLLTVLEKQRQSEVDVFFKGKYTWFFYSERHNYFDASFLVALRSSNWLLTNQGVFKSPSEVTLAELAGDYEKETREARTLIEKLQFKPDLQESLLQQFSVEEREVISQILELWRQGISSQQIKELVEQVKSKKKPGEDEVPPEKGWHPEYKPDEIPPKIEEFKEKPKRPIPENPTDFPPINVDPDIEPEPPEPYSDKKKDKRKIADHIEIGKWGEGFVFERLQKDYEQEGNLERTDFGFRVTKKNEQVIEVFWLNLHSNTGEGCDFIVKIGGQEEKYVEVKTRTGGQPELREITGPQWELAREKGDKYWLYVVSNPGSKESRIILVQNPVKLWQEGKIFAHPVNIKL